MKDISVIFEDEDVLVINKPADLIVHADGKTKGSTLVDYVVTKLKIDPSVGEPLTITSGEVINRAGIVHRLDKDTTGAIIIAKNTNSFNFLKAQFKRKEIKKTYLAFTKGSPKDSRGFINKSIGRSSTDIRKWATNRTRGELREAITRYRVLSKGKDWGLLILWPETGRTHQIRVHLLSIGHPVLADSLYGEVNNSLNFQRQALHSYKITFKSLDSGLVEVVAPLPEDFDNALKAIGFDKKDLPI